MKFKLIEEYSQKLIDVAEQWLKDNCKANGFVERGLILRDGTIVDNTTYTGNPNDNRHYLIDIALQTYLLRKGFIKRIETQESFTDQLGFIRVNGQNEDYIAITKIPPTEDQYSALRDWLNDYFKRKRSIEVAEWENGSQATYVYPEDDAEYIIKKIRKYYNTGNLEESYKIDLKEAKDHRSTQSGENRLTKEYIEKIK